MPRPPTGRATGSGRSPEPPEGGAAQSAAACIEARARKLFAHEQAWLPIAIQSAELSGKYISVDKVMLLVRTLLSRGEYGQECPPPDRK